VQEEPRVGRIIGGQYRVEARLGSGAMGVVVAATHALSGRPVAVKVLHPDIRGDANALKRFEREGRAAAALKGEHVARVLDVGEDADGSPYMVMERLEGGSLHARLEAGELSTEDLLRVGLDMASALTEAHALGITHRDLKPSNVFVVAKPGGGFSAKVLDFGISKIENRSLMGAQTVTATQGVVGTPAFMAPEQLNPKADVGPSADVWGLGATLYYGLTGRFPYDADSLYDLTVRSLQGDPPSISTSRGDLARPLVDALDGCLRRDPSARWSLTEVAKSLEVALASAGQAAGLPTVRRHDAGEIATRRMVPAAQATELLPRAPLFEARATAPPLAAPRAAQTISPSMKGALVGLLALMLIAIVAPRLLAKRRPDVGVAEPAAALAPVATPSASASATSAPTALDVPPSASTPAPYVAVASSTPEGSTPKPPPPRPARPPSRVVLTHER
jgi:serine/threonine-protein kinase